jgi:hypothetical protein
MPARLILFLIVVLGGPAALGAIILVHMGVKP